VFNDNQRLCRQQGFSLVEVMIALLIFMVIALGLAQGELAALRAHNDNLLRDEALRLAEARLNELKGLAPTLTNKNWTLMAPNLQVNIRGGTVTFVRAVQHRNITKANSAANLMQIDVAVGWDQGNGPALPQPAILGTNHQVSLSTIASW